MSTGDCACPLPHTALACAAFKRTSWPPLAANLFGTGVALCVTAYLLVYPHGAGLQAFLKYFLLVYCAAWYAVSLRNFVRGSVWDPEQPESRALLNWAIGVTSLVFFADLHVVLHIPSTDLLSMWLLYVLGVAWLGAVAVGTGTPLAMLLSGVGIIFISHRVLDLLPLPDDTLGALLKTAGLTGIGISVVVAGVKFGNNQGTVEKWIATKLQTQRAGRSTAPLDTEDEFSYQSA
jgi:hypothetical protein